MSRCFTRFTISILEEPNIYHDSVSFTRMWDFTQSVSECEELVGVTHRRWCGWPWMD